MTTAVNSVSDDNLKATDYFEDFSDANGFYRKIYRYDDLATNGVLSLNKRITVSAIF